MNGAPTDPQVSVIIPCFNSEKFLEATVRSVWNQTFSNFEIIIIDDGSTDGTMDLARALSLKDSRIRIFSQPNAWVAAARNNGASRARGRFVAFLDSDDWWDSRYLETMTGALASNPGFRAVACETVMVLNGVVKWHHALPAGKKFLTLRDCLIANPVQVLAVLIERELFFSAGGFNVAMRHVEDWDLWLRVLGQCNILIVNEALAMYRQHEFQKSKNDLRMARHYFIASNRCAGAFPAAIDEYGADPFRRDRGRQAFGLYARRAARAGNFLATLRVLGVLFANGGLQRWMLREVASTWLTRLLPNSSAEAGNE